MAKNEAKIKFTAETKEFNDSIKKSNDEMSKLRAELKLNEAEMQSSGKSVETLENKHRILAEQLEQSESKTEALRNKLEKAKAIFGENSTEANRLERELLNAQTAELKLRDAVSEAEYQLDRFNKGLEDAGEKSQEASEGFTVMKGAMADLVADGIGAVIEGLGQIGTEAFTMSNDIDKATNNFIAKTGESVESADGFEEVMTSIYNGNYGESFDDIAEAMSAVKTSLGDLSNEELESITTDALVLRDTFDMDVNESVRAVNSLMDQFGITADEAFNLVAQGAQKGLNQNGDLLDVVNEYGVQFKNAGYSAEDMFNMLANGTAAGTWSVDKLGDAVKEFNIRMSDGSAKEAVEALGFSWEAVSEDWSKGGDSAKEVFDMLMTEMAGLEDTTEGYNIGVGLMGTMFEDLGYDALAALSSTQGEITSTKDTLNEINSVKYDDLGSAFEGIKRNLQTSLTEPIKNDVMPAVNEFVEDVDWQGVGQTIGEAFGAIVDAAFAIGEAVAGAVGWMKEHQAVVAAVAAAVGILTVAIGAYNAVNAIKAAMDAAQVTTIWGLVSAHIAQAAAAMAAIAPYVLIVAAIAAVIAIIVLLIKNWDDVVAACKKAWAKVKETLAVWGEWINANVIQPVKNFFSNLWSSVTSAAKNAWSSIKSAWGAVKDWFNSKIIQPVGNFFSNMWDKVSNAAKTAWSNIKNAIITPIEAARDKVKGVVDAIKGFFSNLKIKLPNIKLPHFSIKGEFSLNPPSVPKLSIDWYKDGGIMMRPTVFGINGNSLMAGGEAGPEAILPIDRLEGYISGAIEKAQNVVNLQVLADAIEDLANRPVVMNVNGRQFATATAGDSDGVNGLRTSFRNRGLALD